MKGEITATREQIEGAGHRNNELKRVGYEAAKLVREGLAGMIGKKVGKADGYLTKAAEAIIPHDTGSWWSRRTGRVRSYCGIPKASSEPGEAPTIAPTICGGIHYATFFVRVRLCFVSEKGIATYEETTIDLGRIENDGKLTELLPFPDTAPEPVDVAEQIEKVEAYNKAHQAAAEAWDALHFSVRSLANRY